MTAGERRGPILVVAESPAVGARVEARLRGVASAPVRVVTPAELAAVALEHAPRA